MDTFLRQFYRFPLIAAVICTVSGCPNTYPLLPYICVSAGLVSTHGVTPVSKCESYPSPRYSRRRMSIWGWRKRTTWREKCNKKVVLPLQEGSTPACISATPAVWPQQREDADHLTFPNADIGSEATSRSRPRGNQGYRRSEMPPRLQSQGPPLSFSCCSLQSWAKHNRNGRKGAGGGGVRLSRHTSRLGRGAPPT